MSGLNEPPKEIERSGEIEIESDRDQSIETDIEIKEIKISMEIEIRKIKRLREIEKRKGLRVIGTNGPVKQLESGANNLSEERVSGSERATRKMRDITAINSKKHVSTLDLYRWPVTAAAA